MEEVSSNKNHVDNHINNNNMNNSNNNNNIIFTSGRNLSAIRKVYIRIAPPQNTGAIQRIFLEFERPLESSQPKTPFYDGTPIRSDGSIERVLEIEPNDAIVGVVVWKNKTCVQAILFEMKSGTISELYGFVDDFSSVFYHRGQNNNSRLVGISGRFGEVLQTVNFVFATVVEIPPPTLAEDYNYETFDDTHVVQEYQDAWIGRAIFVSIFISTVLASLISTRRN